MADKLDELRDYGVVPFVFILNAEQDDSLDEIDGVYWCASDLELRLKISDLYLSFAEFGNAKVAEEFAVGSVDAATIAEDNTESSTASDSDTLVIVGDGNNYKTDFETKKHKYSFGASGETESFGMAITSILNIYKCLPLQAESGNDSYSLMSNDLSKTMFDMLEFICTGDTNEISDTDIIGEMIQFWGYVEIRS